MLQLPVQVSTPALKQDGDATYDVSAIIGMSGAVDGAVVLSFPTATAERIVSLFAGEELTHAHEDFADAVGELANMVCGGAKAQFTGEIVNISCPSVVVGSGHVVFKDREATSITIPCTCDCGEFNIDVSIRSREKTEPAPVTEATTV